MKNHYDLISIGGLAVAEKATAFGKKVAIIETKRIGGTCVNNGCVPKKVMWYAANHIVIATGGKPIIPPVAGAESGISSDGFFQLKHQPKRVAIIGGGGYIGVELSGVLRALGSEVTIIALENRVLESFDEMLSHALMKEMQSQGINLKMNFQVNRLNKDVDGIEIIYL